MNTINNTLFIGKVWQHFEHLPSTNAFLAECLAQGLTEGFLVTTFNQTQGRGQMGNTWEAAPDANIAFSVLLTPHFLEAKDQFLLNKAVALAVHDVVAAYCPQTKVKWANDIYVNDKKIAGILIQNALMGSKLQSSIVGIGLNVHQMDFQTAPHATSLKAETGQVFERFELVAQLARALENRYLNLKNRPADTIHAEYLEKMYRFGAPHTFQRVSDGHYFSGTIVGVSAYGQLEIKTQHSLEQFGIKEVKFCI